MASVASGQSPHSGVYDQTTTSSNPDDTESWQFLDMASTANSNSIGFYSPDTGSLQSYAILGPNSQQPQHQHQQQQHQQQHQQQPQPSPPAVSPLLLNNQLPNYPPTSFPDQQLHQPAMMNPNDAFGAMLSAGTQVDHIIAQSQDLVGQFMTSTDVLLAQQQMGGFTEQQMNDISPLLESFSTNLPLTGFEDMELPGQAVLDFGVPPTMQSDPNASPWGPTNLMQQMPPSQPIPMMATQPQPSPSLSGGIPTSPLSDGSSGVLLNLNQSKSSPPAYSPPAATATATTTNRGSIRKVKASKVEKKSAKSSKSSSSASKAGPVAAAAATHFLIMTPSTVNSNSNQPNPYECFEAMARQSTTSYSSSGSSSPTLPPVQTKGRKGPLASSTKESALIVRRIGACFCCQGRKVKCDQQRPCNKCTKLAVQVPGIVCWQFPDFIPVLFPEFIRGHFGKGEMGRFVGDNVAAFTVPAMGGMGLIGGGAEMVEKKCRVELSSGLNFSAILPIPNALLFTPAVHKPAQKLLKKEGEGESGGEGEEKENVLQHYHLSINANQMSLSTRTSLPLALPSLEPTIRDDLRKKLREYVNAIINEPYFAEQTTDAFRHTHLPRNVLRIVTAYNRAAEHPVVKKALSVYAMHYIMTRHLTLTSNSVTTLMESGILPVQAAIMMQQGAGGQWITPRVLNRQIKSVIDEMLMKGMTDLFDKMGKLLKPKFRRDWAPVMAAFLVVCLFMEEVETAADRFVVSQREIELRENAAAEGGGMGNVGAGMGMGMGVGGGIATGVGGGAGGSPATQPKKRKNKYSRSFALNINREVEKLPFRQVAYQFHQIYQTHSRDTGCKGFNPLIDDEAAAGVEEPGNGGGLDGPAVEMVRRIRELVQGESWAELDYLSIDPILPNNEDHPYPRDVSFNYTGRLVSKFLLSFLDERYILDGNI